MMAVTTKFQPFERDVLFDLAGFSPDEQSRALAEFAAEEIFAAEQQNEQALGHEISHTTFVDGRLGADLGSVRPDGVIVANWALTNDVVQAVWEMVVAKAPVLHGTFKASQRLYADGIEVNDPANPPQADEYVITSVAPYARKIERGESAKAPDGIYQAIAAICASRYGNQARIRFSFSNPIGGTTGLSEWAGKRVNRGRSSARETRQPSITISFR